jgi:hypothetical protein
VKLEIFYGAEDSFEIFWALTLLGDEFGYQGFEGQCCSYLQGEHCYLPRHGILRVYGISVLKRIFEPNELEITGGGRK